MPVPLAEGLQGRTWLFQLGGLRAVFSGERCRVINPSISSFNLSPHSLPQHKACKPGVAELPAARHGLLARGCRLTRRVLLGSALYLSRQRLEPGSGYWPGGRGPGDWFHRTGRVGRVQIVGFAFARGSSGGPYVDSGPPWRRKVGAHWAIRWGGRPIFILGGPLGFSPPLLCQDVQL